MIVGLIVAGGRGRRAAPLRENGGDTGVAKQYCHVLNRPLLSYSLDCFLDHASIDKVCVVIHQDDEQLYLEAIGSGHDKLLAPIVGGTTRQSSVLNGLQGLAYLSPTKVFVHDAARPCLRPSLISKLLTALGSYKGVIPALRVTDTIKKVKDETIVSTIDRAPLRAAQTPQLFAYDYILNAHKKAASVIDNSFTDDASIAEWLGDEIGYIDGQSDNLKVTNERDFALAAYYLSEQINETMDLEI